MSKHIFIRNVAHTIDDDEAAFGDLKFIDSSPDCLQCDASLSAAASINNLKKSVICDCGASYPIHLGKTADSKKEPTMATEDAKKTAKKAVATSTKAEKAAPAKTVKAEKAAPAKTVSKPVTKPAKAEKATPAKAVKKAEKVPRASREDGVMHQKLKANPDHEFNPRKGSIPALVITYFKKATVPVNVIDDMVTAFKEQTDVMSATAAKNPKSYMTWYILHMLRTGVLIKAA